MEERIGSGNRAFVVVDRRGEPKPEREVEVKQESEAEANKDKSGWKDVSFILVQMQAEAGIAQVLRAVGKRTDDRAFIADYILPPFWTEEQDMDDWQAEARVRLNTFLNCGCMEGGQQCNKHRNMLPQWLKKDMDRFDKIVRKAMPESLEWYIRAEQARQQGRIVAPGR